MDKILSRTLDVHFQVCTTKADMAIGHRWAGYQGRLWMSHLNYAGLRGFGSTGG